MKSLRAKVLAILPIALLALPGKCLAAAPDLTVYDEGLKAGWDNWSWDTSPNFSATAPLHGGARSLGVSYTNGWAGLYLAAAPLIDGNRYDTLQFWIHGGSQGGQRIGVKLADGSRTFLTAVAVTASAGGWTQVKIPLTDLGLPAQIGGIVWQDATGGPQPTFYLDDITLIDQGLAPPPPTAGPALSVDVAADRHAISEEIYGMNLADEDLAAELELPVRRWGGNATTRYNWQTNMHNAGMDWYFENTPDGAAVADGSASDLFVEQDRRTATRTLMTMPLIGWTPKSDSRRGHPFDCGFKASKYGAQQKVDPWDTDCGNGIYPGGAPVAGNAPADTSTAIGPAFVTGWINHLTAKYGTAADGGVAYYGLDNEPMIWHSTHRDVHPQPLTYDEIRDRTYQYGAAIKAADPSALTLGPTEDSWCRYLYSARDNCTAGADYLSHGNTLYVPWYLRQMKAYEQAHGVRLLDYLDLHFYPQANGVSLSPAGGSATQALRLRSTRGLWDPTYIDESWISDTAPGGVAVEMIPRMKGWVDANYPGTKLAITEYNWGALDHINGALAQADVLGIFGREGVDLATLWDPPAAADPGAFAFRLYLNYDGAGSAFGDQSVQALSADQGSLSVYAAQRSSDKALTIMVINKTAGALTSSLDLAGFTPKPAAAVYRYSTAQLGAIEQPSDQTVTATGFTATFPANSITLFVIDDWCSGPVVTFADRTFAPHETYTCTAATSITAGGAVTISPQANVAFYAPRVTLQHGFAVRMGGAFRTRPSP